MKALLCDSLVCATCCLTRSPPSTAQSSLQSNWKASPGAKASGTKVPRPLVWAPLAFRLPGPHEGCHPAVGAGVAQGNEVGVHLPRRAPLLARLGHLHPKPRRQLLSKRVQVARPVGNLELRLYRS